MLPTYKTFSINQVSPGRLALRMKEPFIACHNLWNALNSYKAAIEILTALFFLSYRHTLPAYRKCCQKDEFLHALLWETLGTANLSNCSHVRVECRGSHVRGHFSLLSSLHFLLRSWPTSRVFLLTFQGNSAKLSPPFPKGLLKSTLWW